MAYLLSLLPALLMWEYLAVKVNFRLDRASRKRLFRIGFLTALAAGLLEYPIHGLVAALPLAPLGGVSVKAGLVGVIEEGVDFVGLLFLADRKHIAAIGPAAAIPLATGIALGFAVFENMFYLGAAALHGTMLQTGVLRAATAIPEHALDGMAMGAFFCLACQARSGFDLPTAILAWAVPALMHAAYDFTAFAMGLPADRQFASLLFPFLLLAEGLMTAALVAEALRGHRPAKGADPSDLFGTRAVSMGGLFLLLGNGVLYLAMRGAHPVEVAAIAVAPMVLGVDLALVGLRRRGVA